MNGQSIRGPRLGASGWQAPLTPRSKAYNARRHAKRDQKRSTSFRAQQTHSEAAPQDPFQEKEVYNDSLADKAVIALFSSLLKNQLGPELSGKEVRPGYEGFVELSKRVMKGRNSEQQRQAISNILGSLLPEQAASQFRRIFPLSKWAAETNARITTLGFFWLVGAMEVQDQEVSFKGREETWRSKVLIKKCRYLEVSGCKGMCLNMCKRPTESFFGEKLGLPLTMDPNFEDLSCEMRFGAAPPPFHEDKAFNEPCFAHVCSLADRDPNLPCPKIETSRWKLSRQK